MSRSWMPLALLAACSGAAAPAVRDDRGAKPPIAGAHQTVSPPALPPVGGIDESAPVPPCPPEPELVATLRERWQVPADARLDVVACARGHFAKGGWLVDVFIDVADDEADERVEIIAADGSGTIAAFEPDAWTPGDRFDTVAGEGWEIVDLDADGIDEILKLQEWNHVAVLSTTLEVFRIEGALIREVGTLRLAFDNKGQKAVTAARIVKCTGRHGLSDGPNRSRHIMVEGTIERSGRQAAPAVASHCPLPGAHRYGLADGKLVEVKP